MLYQSFRKQIRLHLKNGNDTKARFVWLINHSRLCTRFRMIILQLKASFIFHQSSNRFDGIWKAMRFNATHQACLENLRQITPMPEWRYFIAISKYWHPFVSAKCDCWTCGWYLTVVNVWTVILAFRSNRIGENSHCRWKGCERTTMPLRRTHKW